MINCLYFFKKWVWNSNLLPMLRVFEDVLPLYFLASIFEYGFDFAETLAYAKTSVVSLEWLEPLSATFFEKFNPIKTPSQKKIYKIALLLTILR